MKSSLGKQFADFSYKSYSWKYLEKPALNRLLKGYLKRDFKVLEAGCGNGRTIEYLKEKGLSESNITGIDISKKLLKIAKKDYPKSTFIKADISKWKAKNKFDLITCIFVLHYFKTSNVKRVLNNFSSYLKRGGLLMYVVPHPIRWTKENLSQYFKRKSVIIKTPWGEKISYSHKTIDDYINLTIKSGFEILQLDECEVLESGKVDKDNYRKYSAFPSRLVVLARKK